MGTDRGLPLVVLVQVNRQHGGQPVLINKTTCSSLDLTVSRGGCTMWVVYLHILPTL